MIDRLRDAYDLAIGLALWAMVLGAMLAPMACAFACGKWLG